MSLFDKLFQSVSVQSPSNLKAGGRQILKQELIQRPDRFRVAYQEWTMGPKCSEIRQDFYQQYKLKKNHSDQSSLVSLYEAPMANGVHFGYDQKYAPLDFEFLFDFIKEKTVGLKYLPYVSDRIIYERPNFLETVQKHYLKPNYGQNTGAKAHQLYGNILVEHILVDDQPNSLKILATTYSDSKYYDPLPFEQYLEEIFQ